MAVIKVPTKNRWSSKPDYVLDYSALEAGDRVAVLHSSRYGGASVTVYTVARTTAKQFILKTGGHNHEYRRWTATGREVGSSYGSVPTAVDHPDVLAALQHREMREFAKRVENVMKVSDVRTRGYADHLALLAQLSTLIGETSVLLNQLQHQLDETKESTDV